MRSGTTIANSASSAIASSTRSSESAARSSRSETSETRSSMPTPRQCATTRRTSASTNSSIPHLPETGGTGREFGPPRAVGSPGFLTDSSFEEGSLPTRSPGEYLDRYDTRARIVGQLHTAMEISRAHHVCLPADGEDGTVETAGRGSANKVLGETQWHLRGAAGIGA